MIKHFIVVLVINTSYMFARKGNITSITSYAKLPRDIFANVSIFLFMNLLVTLMLIFFFTVKD